MAQRRPPGLTYRGGIWHIDKKIKDYGRLCESTGEKYLVDAIAVLHRRVEQIRLSTVYGIRPKTVFREAAAKYQKEYANKRSISRDELDLRTVMPFIGHLELRKVHDGTLERFKRKRLESVAPATVNRTLAIVRRVLNLAARKWKHEGGISWLETAPLIEMVPNDNPRLPYPLSWEEQARLFGELPKHLALMALFKVNTGTREQEVVNLQWAWEFQHGFIIPKGLVKNKTDRLVVLNSVARAVIESCRGHPTHVFTFKGRPVVRMNTAAWRKARTRAGLKVRVHDLKHTFGRRLRAAGVSLEDRRDLLGHKSANMTTHYSAPELENLVSAAEKAVESRKTPAMKLVDSGSHA